MSYRCGTAGLTPLGIADDSPHIRCDACGTVYRVRTDRLPPAWFLDGKAPPGWRLERSDDSRRDFCPRCVAEPEVDSHG